MKIETELIPPSTAARMLGIHMNTLRAWSASGIIQELRTPNNHRRFRRQDVQQLLDNMATKTLKETK